MVSSSAYAWSVYYVYARCIKDMSVEDSEQYADERTVTEKFRFNKCDSLWSIEAMMRGVKDVYTADGWIN